jgi:hypothetical protein
MESTKPKPAEEHPNSWAIQVFLTGHLYRNSPYETDSSCGNCDGGRCDDENGDQACFKRYRVESVGTFSTKEAAYAFLEGKTWMRARRKGDEGYGPSIILDTPENREEFPGVASEGHQSYREAYDTARAEEEAEYAEYLKKEKGGLHGEDANV